MISDRTASIIIGVVTCIWVANIVAGMAQWNEYRPSETINGIFLTIVGGAFALRAKSQADKNKEKEEAEEKAKFDAAVLEAAKKQSKDET